MPTVTSFVSDWKYMNVGRLPLSTKGVVVPHGLLTIPEPIFVPKSEMTRLSLGKSFAASPGGNVGGILGGLTDTKLTVTFADFDSQWQIRTNASGEKEVQFQGGSIYLQLDITVYIKKDVKGSYLFPSIYSHELEHVRDEIDIVRNYVATAVEDDNWLRDVLFNNAGTGVARVINAKMFDRDICRIVTSRDRVPRRAIENDIWEVYSEESDLRTGKLDTASRSK
jgi:hypothetical protein